MTTTAERDPALVLAETFGFSSFRPGQREVIDHLLAGRSSAAVFATGSGKSLCYQLPALLLPGTTVVVSPLIALMKDQLDALLLRGVPAARLDSTLDLAAYREVMQSLRSGRLKLLYVAPERFVNERFREALAQVKISLLAIDEAHCVSEWGHNFRPDYLKLADHRRRLGVERVLALTATAPPRVLDEICRRFDIDRDCAVTTGFYRPNLDLIATPTLGAERDALLISRLRSRQRGAEAGPAIVYVTLRKTAETLAKRLTAEGFEALVYHAGQDAEVRAATQERFLHSKKAIVVATIAFGMGIDKADLRAVYHYDVPKSLENLAQETGRAGRDGEPAHCEMLVSGDGLEVLRNFAHGDVPDAQAVRYLLGRVFTEKEDFVLDLYSLSHDLDIRPLVLRTLLTYLELENLIEAGTPLYQAYRFKPLASSKEILGRFEGERREFLAALLRQASKKKIWFEIDLDAAAKALNQPRLRLVRALDYLAELGLMELEATQLRHTYRVRQRPPSLDALAEDLYQRTLAVEKRELERLDQVLELASLPACRWNHLCAHFGETREEPCGHCSYCHDGKVLPLPPPTQVEIDEDLWSAAKILRVSKPALVPNRAMARFLTGLSSPRASRARLGSHDLFGAFEDVPFAKVLARLELETPSG